MARAVFVCIILAVFQPCLSKMEENEVQLMRQEFLQLQQQMDNMQQHMATQRQEMQHEQHQIVNDMNTKLDRVLNKNQKLYKILNNFVANKLDLSKPLVNSMHNGTLISFSAYSNVSSAYDNYDIVQFPAILTNEGSFYSSQTSSFLCFVPGFYMFSLTVKNYRYSDFIAAEIQVDESTVANVFSDTGDLHSDSNTVVVHCPQFAQVLVRAVGNGNSLFGDPNLIYSTFTGTLLLQT